MDPESPCLDTWAFSGKIRAQNARELMKLLVLDKDLSLVGADAAVGPSSSWIAAVMGASCLD